MDIAYDGSRFYGYAKQPNVRTVQGELENVLEPHIGAIDASVAGRTDKGVHASEQVVSFRCADFDTEYVRRSLNKQLSPEIAVRSIEAVADDFHARFSATGRAYRYRIRNSDVHDPLTAIQTWTFSPPLDVDSMNEALSYLIGIHDFAAFCRKQEDRSTTRELLWAHWRRRGIDVELSIGASAFCHQMVRSIVALCVEVGKGGDIDVAAVPGILASKNRKLTKGVAPPGGLVLVAVAYDYEPLPRPSWIPETS